MKIFVTGITGFIGRSLIPELLLAGHEISGVGRRPRPIDFPKQVEYHQISEWKKEILLPLLKDSSVVIHCAGKAGTWGSYSEYFTANVSLTEVLLKASKEGAPRKFINISSPSIYFQYKDQLNLKENDIPEIRSNSYAETKFLAENLVREAHDDIFWTLSLRPRGVIGAGDANWFPRIIELYQAGRLICPGGGGNLTDFTSVKNLVGLIASLINAPRECFGDVYNITNDEPSPLWDVIRFGLEALGEKPKIKKLPLSLLMFIAKVSELFARVFGVRNEPKLLPLKIGVASYSMTLNIDKAKEKLSYEAKQSTREALNEFAKWWTTRQNNR